MSERAKPPGPPDPPSCPTCKKFVSLHRRGGQFCNCPPPPCPDCGLEGYHGFRDCVQVLRDRARDAEARALSLEASCAAMREALERFERVAAPKGVNPSGEWDTRAISGEDACAIRDALASDAGRALLEEVEGLMETVRHCAAHFRTLAGHGQNEWKVHYRDAAEALEAAIERTGRRRA